METYLVNVSRETNQIQITLGLCVLANSLKMHKIEPKIIDLIPVDVKDRVNHFKKKISKNRAIYGFGITIGNDHINVTENYARMVKEANPDNIVVYGGALATSSSKLLLENCLCDYVIAGEAEFSFPALIKSIENGDNYSEDIDGLYYMKEGTVYGKMHRKLMDLGPFSNPDYSLFDMDFYIGYLKETSQSWEIMASRGCVANCSFCYKMVGHGISLRTPDAVLDEMEEIISKHDLRKFYFVDDNLLGIVEWFQEFIRRKRERNMEFTFVAQARMDAITKEICQLGKDNGLVYISVGIESTSQKTLNKIRKKITLDEVREKIKMVDDMNIPLSTNLIVGFEWETEDDYRETLGFIAENKLEQRINMHYLTPLPKTTIYKDAKKKGLIRDEFEYIKNMGDLYWELYLNMTDLSDSVLQYWFDQMIKIGHRDIAFPTSEKYLSKLSDKYFKRVPEEKRLNLKNT